MTDEPEKPKTSAKGSQGTPPKKAVAKKRAPAKTTSARKKAARTRSQATTKAEDVEETRDDDIYAFADTLQGNEAAVEEVQEAPEAWVTFRVGGGDYALPVEDVQEVLRVGYITPVPQTPPSVRGVTNLRGRVLAVVDLALRLGLEATALDEHCRILVVRFQGRPVGLLIRAINQMDQVLPSTLGTEEELESFEHRELLRGVAKLEDRLVALLALSAVLELDREDSAA